MVDNTTKVISDINELIDYMTTATIETFDSSKINYLRKDLLTESSKDITDEMIRYAMSSINRTEYVVKISDLLCDLKMAHSIENSIYEYSLIHVTLNNIDKKFVWPVYYDKFCDIYDNLDENSRFKNKTLKSILFNGLIDPRFVAFLSPVQMHPESLQQIIDKIKHRETTQSNMATTDLYKCYRCGERKCKITELQLRSADEPSSKFITCLVCYNTFIK